MVIYSDSYHGNGSGARATCIRVTQIHWYEYFTESGVADLVPVGTLYCRVVVQVVLRKYIVL